MHKAFGPARYNKLIKPPAIEMKWVHFKITCSPKKGTIEILAPVCQQAENPLSYQ